MKLKDNLVCLECGGGVGKHNLSCSVWTEKTLSGKIRGVMETILEIEPLESASLLAEECAFAMGHDEWLDDPDHEVWEVALEYFED